jgi:ketosteroid isomerase-like protein
VHADALRAALDSRALEVLVGLMDEGVVWRGVPGPPLADAHDEDDEYEHHRVPMCHDRDEVQRAMQAYLDGGGDADLVILGERGDSVLVEVRQRHEASLMRVPPLHQIFTFRGGRVVLIQDYSDRAEAITALG